MAAVTTAADLLLSDHSPGGQACSSASLRLQVTVVSRPFQIPGTACAPRLVAPSLPLCLHRHLSSPVSVLPRFSPERTLVMTCKAHPHKAGSSLHLRIFNHTCRVPSAT